MVRPEPHFNLDSEDTNRFAAEESQLNDAPFPGKAFFRLLIPRKNFATRRERKLQSFEFRIGRNGKRKETLRSVGEDRIFPSLGSAANLAPTADAPWNREARANFPRAVAGLSGLSGRGGHLSKRDCGETDRSIILRSARLLFTQTSPPSFITGEEDGIEPSHEGF